MTDKHEENGSATSGSSLVELPRIAILGTRQGLGLSTIVTGIVGALRKKQTGVAIIKLGSSLDQLSSYRRLTSRLALSLHPWNIRPTDDLAPILFRVSSGAELLIVEGEKGILDPYPDHMGAKNSHDLVLRLSCPTVLVLDGRGYYESLPIMIRGFRPFGVDGVIIVNSESGAELQRQQQILQAAEQKGEFQLIGIIPRTPKPLVEFSPGTPESTRMSRTRLVNTVELIESQLSLSKLIQLAGSASKFEVVKQLHNFKPRSFRVAVADDAAMHSTFQENLDLLRREGIELVPFSPVGDEKLPSNIRGLYLPDGPVEQNRVVLSQNTAMLDSIRLFVRDGGALYAEGSALSYLFTTISAEANEHVTMLGIIRGHASLLERFNHSDHLVECRAIVANLLMRPGDLMRGFRSARWAFRLEEPVPSSTEAFTLEQVFAEQKYLELYPPTPDGFMPRPNVFGTAYQLNWSTGHQVGERFISALEKW